MIECVILHNEKERRFETEVDGQFAYVDYIPYEGGLDFTHTWVPREIGGKGVATALVYHALQYARDNHLKVIASCPFVKAYVQKHDEYRILCQ